MPGIDSDFINILNKRTCYGLIGSGISSELGLPSWKSLVSEVKEKFKKSLSSNKITEIEALIENNKYLDAFEQLKTIIGKDKIVDQVEKIILEKEYIIQPHKNNDSIYDILVNWPFKSYLTTNYDSLIGKYLDKYKHSFLSYINSLENFREINVDSQDLIIKIHGDFSNKLSLVIFKEDYERFSKNEGTLYWRDKLFSILNMTNFIIIGYSLGDPDFNEQLERAKNISSITIPKFIISSGFTTQQIQELLIQYNIKVISYKNPDGSHSELKKLLKRYDPFIIKRSNKEKEILEIDETKIRIASSIFIYTQLTINDKEDNFTTKIISGFVLTVLNDKYQEKSVTKQELEDEIKNKFKVNKGPEIFEKAFENLYNLGYLAPKDNSIKLTKLGKEYFQEILNLRSQTVRKFEKSCKQILDKKYPGIGESKKENVYQVIRRSLITAFEKRGLEISQLVFSDSTIDLSDSSDILNLVSQNSQLHTDIEKQAYIDLMIDILQSPDESIKIYLGALSQAYFTYHALGIDFDATSERIGAFCGEYHLLFDASVLIPLLAEGCVNHEYAIELLKLTNEIGVKCLTTKKFIGEIVQHAEWANRLKGNSNNLEVGLVVQGNSGYKQNLFLSGFVKKYSDGLCNDLEDYFISIFGQEYSKEFYESVEAKLKSLGFAIVDVESEKDFDSEKLEYIEDVKLKIMVLRRDHKTFKNENQCKAEAEVSYYNKFVKTIIFISQSHITKLLKDKVIKTWTPEALFRFLTFYSKKPPKSDIFYQCMTNDFFYSGFEVIDKNALSKFLSPFIKQSKLTLEKEKSKYLNSIGETEFSKIESKFNETEDINKPLYGLQISNYLSKFKPEKISEPSNLSQKQINEYHRLRNAKLQKKKKAENKKARSKKRRKRK